MEVGLRKYWQLACTGFSEASVYRLYTVTSLTGSLLFLLLMFYIWSAIAAESPSVGSVTEIVAYLGAAQMVRAVTIADIERFLGEKIRRGDIVNELKRPIGLRTQTFFYEMGKRSFFVFTRFLPILLVMVAVLNVQLPGLMQSGAFVVSLLLGLLVGMALSYLFTLAVFWTKVEWSLSMTRYLLIQLFGGVMFPLYLLPEGIKQWFFYLPFHTMIDAPVSIFLGRTPLSEVGSVYAVQIIWIVLLLGAGSLLWKLAKRKITIQGG